MIKIQKSDFKNFFGKIEKRFSCIKRDSKKAVSGMKIESFSSQKLEKNYFNLYKETAASYTPLTLPDFNYRLDLNFECNYEPRGGVVVYDDASVGTILYHVDGMHNKYKYNNEALERQYSIFNNLIKNKVLNIYSNEFVENKCILYKCNKEFLIKKLLNKRNSLMAEILSLVPRNRREFEERCEKYDLIESELRILDKAFDYAQKNNDKFHVIKVLFSDYKVGQELNELQEWVLENYGGVNVYAALIKNAVVHAVISEENGISVDNKLKTFFKQHPGEEVAFINQEQQDCKTLKSRKKQLPAVIFEYAVKV